MPIAPRLVAEINAHLPGAVRRGDAPLLHAGREQRLVTGFPDLDAALEGGLPRGSLSELVGQASAGLTSLVQRLVGHVTAQAHVVAWIDAPDAFDPASAVAAGVDLERLLWVRPPDLATAFAATEALLAMGGFPLVLLDASAAPLLPRESDRTRGLVPAGTAGRGSHGDARIAGASHAWMRLARAAASSQSSLVVLHHGPRRDTAPRMAATRTAGSSAAVRLELQPLRIVWGRAPATAALLDGLVAHVVVLRNRGGHGHERRVVLELM